NHDNEEEVNEQVPLLPAIFRNASEVIVWPGTEDRDSATALAFVPVIVNLENIDELVTGSQSPYQTPSKFGTPTMLKFGEATDLDSPSWPNFPQHHGSAIGRRIPDMPRTPTKVLSPITYGGPEEWQHLVEFMTRPYFGRRWAFLEVALAQAATIY